MPTEMNMLKELSHKMEKTPEEKKLYAFIAYKKQGITTR